MNSLKLAGTLCTASLILALGACDVDKTQDGEMPNVEVSDGQLPEYDVDTADVDVGTKTVEVEVPDVDVDLPDEEEDSLDR